MNGFGGPSWYRSIETVYEEEGGRVLKVATLTVGVALLALSAVRWTAERHDALPICVSLLS